MNEHEKHVAVAKDAMRRFKSHGIETYIYHVATTGSVYVKFTDERLRSIRIGNHNGRSKYRYKWNLRSDVKRHYTENDRGATRFYFNMDTELPMFIQRVLQYYNTIKRNEVNHENH